MIKKKIDELRKKFNFFGIDGYIIPKNDEYFGEYAQNDRLKKISNFSGSAGCAIILKKKNYLFVDGRYTIQAEIEAGKYFRITSYEKIINCKILKNLIVNYNGGPTGGKSLAISINEDIQTIEDVYEPYLIKQGFIQRTSRGRIASQRAFDLLGKKITDKQQRLFK